METHQESFVIPKRRRHWLRGVGCGVLILLILAIPVCMWRRHAVQQRLDQTLAELDRTDPGWRLADLEAARDEVPDAENSARLIVAAAQQFPRSWPPDDLSGDHFWDQPPNEMLSGEDFLLLSSELSRVKSAVAIAAELADMPRGRHRLRVDRNSIPTGFTDQLNSQRILTLLVYESMRMNQKGEGPNALIACRAALNAARSLGDEPFTVSQLIRSTGVVRICRAIERTLGQGEPPLEDMVALQKLLENEDAFPGLLTAVRGQRAAVHQMFQGVERGEITLDDLTDTRMSRLESAFFSLWQDIREDHALYLSMIARCINVAQQPMHEQAALEQEFQKEVSGLPEKAFLSRLHLPAIFTFGENLRRKHALLRCAFVALAAEHYRRDEKAWPGSLDQLCPHFLSTVPLDPFDGEPLRYRRVEDGIIIYSVSSDTIDDNGNLGREHPDQPGVDLGIRLWDVSKRRQPPRSNPLDE